MNCILFRHGIAMDRESWDGPDGQRPLTAKGAEKTRQAAAGLVEVAPPITHVLSSPYLRAKETAKLVRDAFGLRAEVQFCDELLPDSPPDKLLVLLNSLPPDASVICVGHEPHLGDAAALLLFGEPGAGLALKKAGACAVEFDGAPKAGKGMLHWWLTPGQLRVLRKGGRK
jgi:phosphohistidine phosphatase